MLGTKRYELSNHLGNVLSVITDNIRLQADSKGYADEAGKDEAWEGSYFSMSMGLSFRRILESKVKWLKNVKDIGGSSQETNTYLLFPKPKSN